MIRKIRYRKLHNGGKEKVVILNNFVRQVLKIKKTKRGAESEAKRLNESKWAGYWWNHKVVKTDQGYAIVLIPKHISKKNDIECNSVKVQRPYLMSK